MKWGWLLGLVLMALPSVSEAALTINEVAWMGTDLSANDEWIELYNDGASLTVDGWTLSDGMNLEIELVGTVGPGEYAVLERTDDDSAPGSAFLLYTGALPNTGATLVLRNASGAIQDQVAGGEDWGNIGGDNATKETAQYTSGGWVTSSATPGQQNSFVTVPDTNDTSGESTETESAIEKKTIISGETSKKNIQMKLAEKNLSILVTAPKIAYVNQPVTFSAEPTGLARGLLESLTYVWNFGDIQTTTGKEVQHMYGYPGTYVVMLTASYARHSASLRHEVTVLPVAFSITQNSAGDLQISNDSKYEIDLSGYSVKGSKTIVFPEDTILLPNNTITIPQVRLGESVVYGLFDSAVELVASTVGVDSTVTLPKVQDVLLVKATPRPAPSIIPASDFTFANESVKTNSASQTSTSSDRTVPKNTATVNQANLPIDGSTLPYLGLVALLTVGILGLYAGKITDSGGQE